MFSSTTPAHDFGELTTNSPSSLSTPRQSVSSSDSAKTSTSELFNSKEKLIVIVDSIDNYKNNNEQQQSSKSLPDSAGVYVKVFFDNQVRVTSVKTFSSNTNPWHIKLGKRVIIPYATSVLNVGKLWLEVFETTGETKTVDKRLGRTEPIKISAFDMNHPVEFSLNLTDEIQVQFRFMRAPLANRGHFKAMEQGIYSLLLKMKMQGDGILDNRRIDTEEEEEIEEEEVLSRTPKVIKSGYLIKRGQGNFAKWARRYVELDDNLLLKYFASDSEEDRKEPLGIVVIDSDSMIYVPRDEAMEKELQKQKNIEKSKEFVYYNQALLIDEDDPTVSMETIDDLDLDEQQTINLIRRKRRELELRGPMLDVDELYPYYLLASTDSEHDRNQIIDEIIESIENEETEPVKIKSQNKEERKLDKFLNLVNPKGFKFSLSCQISFSNGKEHENREHIFIADSEEARKEWITSICDHILLEEKRTDLRDPEEEITTKIFPYLDFFELLTTNTDLNEVVRCFNSFQLNVSEKMVAPLLTLFDSSDSPKPSVDFVKAAVTVEVDCAESSGTLFRRNSLSSKLVTLFFKVFGLRYLTKTIKPFLLKLIKENKSYEIDDEKVASSEVADKNAELLEGLCSEVLTLITNSQNNCPIQIREVLSHTFSESEKKYPSSGEMCVGGLLFLRFFCPALVTPQLFGLVKDPPPKNVQRTLTLLTKILQNVANQIQVSESKKEKFMKRVETYTANQIEKTKQFLRTMSEEPKKEIKEIKEIVPDTIKLQSLEFIAHHFGEAFAKKYYNFEGDVLTEITFYKFANQLALITKQGLDKRIKQLVGDGPIPQRVYSTLRSSQSKSPTSSNSTPSTSRVKSPVTLPTASNHTIMMNTTTTTSNSLSPNSLSVPTPNHKQASSSSNSPTTPTSNETTTSTPLKNKATRSPSISVVDVERSQSANVKKVDSSKWQNKKQTKAPSTLLKIVKRKENEQQ